MSPRRRSHRAWATAVATAAATLLLAPAAAAGTACDDLLVTHRPSGSVGDVAASTVTSQAFERGSDGWATVGWDVAAGTQVRTVLVESGGELTELPATARSASGDVEALHVCGTSVAGQPDGEASTRPDDAAQVAAAGPGRTGGSTGAGPGLLGAAIGAAIAGVVLIGSRGARRGAEVLG